MVDVQRDIVKGIFRVVDMKPESFHLGHHLILPAKNRTTAYDFVLDKLKSKLNGYKANKISHAGRLVLIKSVLAALHVYYMSNILFSKKMLAKMNAVIRDFWWTGVQEENQKKPLYLKAWAEICKSKKEGGLGIRNLEAINKAILVNYAWKIVTTNHSITARILKYKYFSYTSFWKVPTNILKSAFWSSILKVREPLINAVTLQISKGNTCIWSSPWCPFWNNIHDSLFIQNSGFHYPATIKDLWIPNTKVWNMQLLVTLFGQQKANIVSQIPINASTMKTS